MTVQIEPILHSFSYSLGYLREQIEDVPQRRMTFQPLGVPNHPAWTIGHLVFIAQAIGEVLGLKPWLDDVWAKTFGPGSEPVADEAVYPEKAELLAALNVVERLLTDSIRDLEDSALDRAFPDAEFEDVFPTVRHALTQVLVGHTSFHIGQISVWRRACSLPPMKRSFE